MASTARHRAEAVVTRARTKNALGIPTEMVAEILEAVIEEAREAGIEEAACWLEANRQHYEGRSLRLHLLGERAEKAVAS